MPSGSFIAGILVGGASRRMGTTKGLLPAPDGSGRTLVERLVTEIAVVSRGSPIFLVGKTGGYDDMKLPVLEDEEPRRGPLSGLVALLAEGERLGVQSVLCVASDHPYLRAALLRRLVHEAPDALIHCPFVDDRYQPLVARYAVELVVPFRVALRQGKGSLQPLLREYEATTLNLDPDERLSLKDWDTPDDREGKPTAR